MEGKLPKSEQRRREQNGQEKNGGREGLLDYSRKFVWRMRGQRAYWQDSSNISDRSRYNSHGTCFSSLGTKSAFLSDRIAPVAHTKGNRTTLLTLLHMKRPPFRMYVMYVCHVWTGEAFSSDHTDAVWAGMRETNGCREQKVCMNLQPILDSVQSK